MAHFNKGKRCGYRYDEYAPLDTRRGKDLMGRSMTRLYGLKKRVKSNEKSLGKLYFFKGAFQPVIYGRSS